MVKILIVARTDGQIISIGDRIEFLEDGLLFKKGEIVKVQKFGNDGKLFYYNNDQVLSTDDNRFKIIKNIEQSY